jgi:HSP20 family protein
MLVRSDPFRDRDPLAQQAPATRMRPAGIPMDAYRRGDQLVVHFDLPGIEASSVDVTVERNVLTVAAERQWQPSDDEQIVVSERPQGTFSRQLLLGESLDPGGVEAAYDDGVLTVTIPLAKRAEPRRVQVGSQQSNADSIDTGSTSG